MSSAYLRMLVYTISSAILLNACGSIVPQKAGPRTTDEAGAAAQQAISPSPAIQRTSAPTTTSRPAATSTRTIAKATATSSDSSYISTPVTDLKYMLFEEGDLPAQISTIAGVTEETFGVYALDLPPPFQAAYTGFTIASVLKGSVMVMLYDSSAILRPAFAALLVDMVDPGESVSENVVEIGDQATFTSTHIFINGKPVDRAELAFTRCGALVHIRLWDEFSIREIAIAYAQRLDGRLGPLVCRET